MFHSLEGQFCYFKTCVIEVVILAFIINNLDGVEVKDKIKKLTKKYNFGTRLKLDSKFWDDNITF